MLSKKRKLWTIGVIGLVLLITVISIIFTSRNDSDLVEESAKVTVRLNGDNPQLIEVGTEYTEQGIKFFNEDGNEISVEEAKAEVKNYTSAIELDKLGKYIVKYKVFFLSGETTEITREVIIQDTTSPVISLLGQNPYELKIGEEFVEQGYEVSDNYDKELEVTSDISKIIFDKEGDYAQVYSAVDKSGNATTVEREIKVLPKDYNKEGLEKVVVDGIEFTAKLNGKNPQYVGLGNKYTESGISIIKAGKPITAEAAKAKVDIDSKSINTNKAGSYTVKYTITFSDGKVIKLSRTVIVTSAKDYYTVQLSGENPQYIEVGTKYDEKGVVLYKNDKGIVDPIIAGATVKIDASAVNVNVLGKYTVKYTVTFSDGKVSVLNRVVIVKDSTAPTITLLGANPYRLKVGDKFIEQGYKVSDNYDAKPSVTVYNSEIDMNKKGEYTQKYVAIDSSGNSSVIYRKIVISDKESGSGNGDNGDNSGTNPSPNPDPEKPKPNPPDEVVPPVEPDPGKPGQPVQPDPGKPDPIEPDPGKPGQPGKPDPGKPDPSEPDPGKPEQPVPPDPSKPEQGKPEPGVPEQPAPTDPGKPEQPVPEKPKPVPPDEGEVIVPEKPEKPEPEKPAPMPPDGSVEKPEQPQPGKPSINLPEGSIVKPEQNAPEPPQQEKPSQEVAISPEVATSQKSEETQVHSEESKNVVSNSESDKPEETSSKISILEE